MALSRKDARNISADASRAGATVFGGQLELEDGQFVINKSNISDLLNQLEGQNVLLIAAPISNEPDKDAVKTCLTCGHEYSGRECPRCANARSRLRGRR